MIEAGKTLAGRFELLEAVGAGGMSVVYKARHLVMNQIVCIKVLRPQVVAGNTGVKRLQAEGKALAALQHPNILRCLAMDTANDCTFLVTEFVDGIALDKVLAGGALQPDRALRIFSELTAGLAFAHSKNVVHRDLKPSNIIITNTAGIEHAKILDFGIAKILDNEQWQSLTKSGMLVGTPQYMAPEQCEAGTCDARSDIYSLGCMLYECITGTPPFTADSALELMVKHVHEAPPVVPGHLGAVAAKAMAKDPAERFQTALEFAKALEDEHYSFRRTNPALGIRISHKSVWCTVAALCAAVTVTVITKLPNQRPSETKPIQLPNYNYNAHIPTDRVNQTYRNIEGAGLNSDQPKNYADFSNEVDALLAPASNMKPLQMCVLCTARGRVAWERDHNASDARKWFEAAVLYADRANTVYDPPVSELMWLDYELGRKQEADEFGKEQLKKLFALEEASGSNPVAAGIHCTTAEIFSDDPNGEQIVAYNYGKALDELADDPPRQIRTLHRWVVNTMRVHPGTKSCDDALTKLEQWKQEHSNIPDKVSELTQYEYDFARTEVEATKKRDTSQLWKLETQISQLEDRDPKHTTDKGMTYMAFNRRLNVPKAEINAILHPERGHEALLDARNRVVVFNDKYDYARLQRDLVKFDHQQHK